MYLKWYNRRGSESYNGLKRTNIGSLSYEWIIDYYGFVKFNLE